MANESIPESLARLTRLVRAIRPDVTATLRGPAQDDDLARLRQSLSVPIPAELEELLRIHDGQEEPSGGGLFATHSLLSCCGIARVYTLLAGGRDVYVEEPRPPAGLKPGPTWRPGWVPFAGLDVATFLLLDLDPGPGGRSGQVFARTVYRELSPVLAGSLAEFIARCAVRVAETGELAGERELLQGG